MKKIVRYFNNLRNISLSYAENAVVITNDIMKLIRELPQHETNVLRNYKFIYDDSCYDSEIQENKRLLNMVRHLPETSNVRIFALPIIIYINKYVCRADKVSGKLAVRIMQYKTIIRIIEILVKNGIEFAGRCIYKCKMEDNPIIPTGLCS